MTDDHPDRPPQPRVDAADPASAFAALQEEERSALVDVRTRAEWTFVGVPDLGAIDRPLWLVEWARLPDMAPNPGFVEAIAERLEERPAERLFFLCRSGARSMAAASAVAEAFAARGVALHCTNVAEGFEGDRDGEGHRGRLNGWKVHGLPWVQG